MRHKTSARTDSDQAFSFTPVRRRAAVLFVCLSLLFSLVTAGLSYFGFGLHKTIPFFLFFITITVCALVVGLFCSALFSGPFIHALSQITRVIDHVSRGEPASKVRIHDPLFQGLGEALNQMSKSVTRRFQALSDDRLRVVTILSSMVEGVIVLDAQGRILLVNDSFEAMFKHSRSELTGAFYYEKLRHYALNKLVEEVIETGKPRAQEIKIDLPKPKYFQVQASVAEANKKRSLILVFHDISGKRRQEEIRKDFVANISHELRTPISIEKGYLEALLDGAMADEIQAREFLEILQNNCGRMEHIVLDLLQISRIESGLNPVRAVSFSLKTHLEKNIDALRPLALKKNQTIDLRISPDLTMTADPDKLDHAFTNLIENAIKYTEAQGRIIIEAHETANEVTLHVKDNGIGIPAQDLPRVFERFYRVDRARSRALGGTGLGLSIVKQVVEAHGGTVSVKNNPEKGVHFTMTFPKQAGGA